MMNEREIQSNIDTLKRMYEDHYDDESIMGQILAFTEVLGGNRMAVIDELLAIRKSVISKKYGL